MDDRTRQLADSLEAFARQRARDELNEALREPWAAFAKQFTDHLSKNVGGHAALAGLARTLPDTFDQLFKLAAPAVEGAAVDRMSDSIARAAQVAGLTSANEA